MSDKSAGLVRVPNHVKIDGRTRLGRHLKTSAARRNEIVIGLLAGLGRPATMADRIAASGVAALQTSIEQRETQGLDCFALRKQLVQLLRASPFRGGLAPTKSPSAPDADWSEWLAKNEVRP